MYFGHAQFLCNLIIIAILITALVDSEEQEEYHIIRTTQSLIKFPLSSPNLQYFAVDPQGVVSYQGFAVTFDRIYEMTASQSSVVSELDLSKVGYSINYSEPSLGENLHLVNYTIGDHLGKLIFQVPEEDLTITNPLSLSNVTVRSGSVKFSMVLAGWQFESPQDTLHISAAISTTDGAGMEMCWLYHSEHPYFPQYEQGEQPYGVFQTTDLVCDTDTLRASLSLLGFANVVPFYSHESSYILSADTKASLVFRNGSESPLLPSLDDSTHKDCNSVERDTQSISSVSNSNRINTNHDIVILNMRLDFPSFIGSLVYDPQLSILFGGGSSSGDSDGCASSSNSILSDPIFWLSVSFFAAAIVISVIVAASTRIEMVSKIMKGKEGSRIHKLRRKSKRPSESCQDF